ncbi:M12 family metallopeptidase [Sphingomonas sp. S2-65]|uniref:M12 family metallopeptidase n=1 Tax=Sphingomonas sp. S2-65 TaxID=2903960 RepID=UPI001F2054DD|nr:M12 family metallopeptidase [Sphingomonas sp. S2-65]UYY57086.1 M12 family metallopeptidase [Sphingomonas sp. S2-65]
MSNIICILLSAVLSPLAYAQNREALAVPVEVLPDYITRRVISDAPEQTLSELARTGSVERGIIVGAKRWDVGVPISVCFFGGSRELRRHIVEVASIWERQGALVSFDFGDRIDPNLCRSNRVYDIRIGYTQPGYWSMIGQDSLVHVGQLEESMNFQRFDISPPTETEFQRVVLHEFGHALGFYHEHQQQDEGCEGELNWPAVYQYLGGPPNNWSQETIDFNLRSSRYMTGDIKTDFNVKSIMLYTFPIDFYRDGARNRCYSPGNTALSPGDTQLLRMAYGNEAITRASSTAAITAAVASFSAPERAALRTRLNLFKADQATKNQILRVGNAQFTDVDIKACSTAPATLASVETVTQFLNAEPKVGMLRYRGTVAPAGNEPGIMVLADADHPEITDARRIVASLSSRYGKQVSLAENPGRDRWLLTIVVCGGLRP